MILPAQNICLRKIDILIDFTGYSKMLGNINRLGDLQTTYKVE